MLDTTRQVLSLGLLGLAILLMIASWFREGFWRLVPTDGQEKLAFVGLGLLAIAFLLDPQLYY